MKNYKYFNGEKECPFTDFGRSFWWKVEMYAAHANDDKDLDMLSMTMVNYLQEHHWDGACQHDTTKEEMLKRADKLYNHGIWSGDYIRIKRYTFQQAKEYSNSN